MTKHLITSATPYINGVKHLGNVAGSLLPADVHARFLRQRGEEVLFVCGTDEHGTPAEIAARDAGVPVSRYCDEQHALQADVYRRFGFSFDHFGRSSSPQNVELTQHLYRRLDAAGLIEEREVDQVWSAADRRFLPDRYVLGTCPRCGHGSARGDQCDGCGTLLDPTELVSPRSALSGSTDLERRSSRHLFLRQSALRERLSGWIDGKEGWPRWVTSLARSWLGEGLRDRCITRDLEWGVPVPRPGFEGKVFYVWFDAPIGYLAATKEWSDLEPDSRDWKEWWQGGDGVRYVQFLGQDNVPFHTVGFPATLLGSGEPWKTVDVVKGFRWLTFEGGKFSTSGRRGIFADAALETLPADAWRWWLTANAPETSDVDFTVERFVAETNKDLADVVGNLVRRTQSYARKAFGETLPPGAGTAPADEAFAVSLAQSASRCAEAHQALEFRKAVAAAREAWSISNAYLHAEAPWTCEDGSRAATVVHVALNAIEIAARLSWSVVPNLCDRILASVGREDVSWPADPRAIALGVDAARPLEEPSVPFPRIDASVLGRFAAGGTGT